MPLTAFRPSRDAAGRPECRPYFNFGPASRVANLKACAGSTRSLWFAAAQEKRAGAPIRSAGPICSGGGIRTRDLRVMRTSYSFRCRRMPFVVWTFSSPSAEPLGACRQVSTPSPESGLGSGLPVKASPNLTGDHAQVSSRAARGLRISCTACKEHATPIEPDELPAAPPRDVGPAIIRTRAITCNEPLVAAWRSAAAPLALSLRTTGARINRH